MGNLRGAQMSGTEFAKAKEDTAAIMRAKQAAGTYLAHPPFLFALKRWVFIASRVVGRQQG